jgi:hypothetical protein
MVGIQLRNMTRRADPRIRDQNIDWSKFGVDSLGRVLYRVGVTNIRSNGNSAALNGRDDLIKQILSTRYQSESRTARGNLQRQTFSDPGRGAGYHDSLVCPESHVIYHFPFVISHLPLKTKLVVPQNEK